MDTVTQKERIFVELVRQTLKLAPFAVTATVLNAFILVILLWEVISHQILLIWVSATFFLAFIRSIFLYKYRPAALRPDQAPLVARVLVIGLGLSGILWGCAGIFLFPVNSQAHQILIVFVLCGMVAGATGTFASVIAAFIAFTIPALVPVIIRFLAIGGDIYYGMSAMTLLYIVLTLTIARRINVANTELIKLRENLSRMVEALEKSNIRMQDEIVERRQVEESLRNSEAQLRFLSSRLLSAQEEERKRIAHELHDSIGGSLGAVQYGLQHAGELARSGADLSEAVENLISMVQYTRDEARRIYANLRPSMLDELGVIPAIGWFCGQFESIHPDIELKRRLEVEEEAIPEDLKIVLFRIIQEAFQNIAKHSGADLVEFSLCRVHDSMQVTITDNGVGFEMASVSGKGGLGMSSMRERVQLSGGTFSVDSAIGRGTTVRAAWEIWKQPDC